MRKLIIISTVLVLLFTAGNSLVMANEEFKDVQITDNYYEALVNISSLKIMNGVGGGLFLPEEYLTREQFAKVIISASGGDEEVAFLRGTTVFPDVESTRWSSGFINLAVKNGYIKGMPDGDFHPTESITYAQACTVLVKSLSYTDEDVVGLWPQNYIVKAIELGINGGLILNPNDKIKRKNAVIMLHNLLNTNMKSAGSNSPNIIFADFVELYTECIILENSTTSEKLTDNQVVTDKGIYYFDNKNTDLEVGNTYRLELEDDKIKKVFRKITDLNVVIAENMLESRVLYKENGESKYMYLPEKTIYYHNGDLKNFESISGLISKNTALAFSYNDDKTGYDYCVVIDPEYKLQEVVKGEYTKAKIAELSSSPMVKNGKSIKADQLEPRDLVYSIQDFLGDNKYYAVFDDRQEGEIIDILPSKLSPSSINIEGDTYEISKDFNIEAFEKFNVEDKITAYLGNDGKIVKVYSMKYKTGPKVECIILGNSKTMDNLTKSQVSTNLGVYYILDSLKDLEIGGTYDVVIDEQTIVISSDIKEELIKFTVTGSNGKKVYYKENGKIENISLPENAQYYLNGLSKTYDEITSYIEANTSIVGVPNDIGTGYEYLIIEEPIYGQPRVVSDEIENDRSIRVSDLNREMSIVKDGSNISIKDIENNNVVYEVTDVWGENGYILVVDDKIEGRLLDVKPSKLSPKSIVIEETEYELSEYMNINKINVQKGSFEVNNNITALLGYKGNVIDIYDNTSNYGVIMKNTSPYSAEDGKATQKEYYTKLLLSDGNEVTYPVKKDSIFIEQIVGKLVKYTIDSEGDVTVKYLVNSKDITIDKNDEKIDGSLIGENLKIFNVIPMYGVNEAEVEMLNFDDLPYGNIPKDKVSYINRTGTFDDVNILVLKDLFDKNIQFALIKENTKKKIKSTSRGTRAVYTYKVLVGNSEYTYESIDEELEEGSYHKVFIVNDSIKTMYDKVEYKEKVTKIQALDNVKIKVSNNIYKFANDIKVYFTNKDDELLVINANDLDANKEYSEILIYLDKAFEDGGMVQVISVKE